MDWDRREVCWIKYGDASMFECWRWDDQWIYHAVDHALDGGTGESYSFTDVLPTSTNWPASLSQSFSLRLNILLPVYRDPNL